MLSVLRKVRLFPLYISQFVHVLFNCRQKKRKRATNQQSRQRKGEGSRVRANFLGRKNPWNKPRVKFQNN